MPESKRLYPNLTLVPRPRNIIRPRPLSTDHCEHIRRQRRTINSNTTNVFNGPVHGFINEAYGGVVDGFAQINQSDDETVGFANSPMGETPRLPCGHHFRANFSYRSPINTNCSWTPVGTGDHNFIYCLLYVYFSQLLLPILLFFIIQSDRNTDYTSESVRRSKKRTSIGHVHPEPTGVKVTKQNKSSNLFCDVRVTTQLNSLLWTVYKPVCSLSRNQSV
jgi:hypothetical protein